MTTFNRIMRTMGDEPRPLAFPLMVTPGDAVKIVDLAAAPHALWAGTTGSGKSVSLNVALAAMIERNEGQIVFDMIDPKRVELSVYRNVEHVRSVTTDMGEAATVVEAMAEEMDERYALLEREGVRKLSDYNDKTGDDLPHRVLVVDELSDLMDTHKAQVLPALVRIGQLGRAAGFHMMLATQRPAADTIPKKLLANVPMRIALLCQSHTESRLVLGEKGAEDLNGHGDMLVQVPGERGLARGQGPFLSDEELGLIIDANAAEDLDDPTDEELDAEEDIDELEDEEPEAELADEIPEDLASTEAIENLSRMLAEAMNAQKASADGDLYERIIILERDAAALRMENAHLNELMEERAEEISKLKRSRNLAITRAEVAEAEARKTTESVERLSSRAVKAEESQRRTYRAMSSALAGMGRILIALAIVASLVVTLIPASISGYIIISASAVAVGGMIRYSNRAREERREPHQRVQPHLNR